MKRILGFLAALMISVSAAPVASADSNALGSAETYPDEVINIVKKGFAAPLSDSEAELLIDEYPEWAAVVPDFRSENIESSSGEMPGISFRAASNCKNIYGMHQSRTLLGLNFYKMHTTLRYCWSGNRVTSISNMNTTFTDISAMAEIGGRIENTQSTGANGLARHKYMVKNVVPHVGQINVKYPHNTFTLYPGGRFAHGHGE